jgi:hypothetical protein
VVGRVGHVCDRRKTRQTKDLFTLRIDGQYSTREAEFEHLTQQPPAETRRVLRRPYNSDGLRCEESREICWWMSGAHRRNRWDINSGSAAEMCSAILQYSEGSSLDDFMRAAVFRPNEENAFPLRHPRPWRQKLL